jgi:CheY-like chemotaxis protein
VTDSALRILVVDDDRMIRHVVAQRLLRDGHQVDQAGDGVEALARMGAAPFDIVITDLEMPDMDGHELLVRLREEQPLVRSIVMTGWATQATLTACLEEGAFTFVTKPLGDMTELMESVRQAGWVLAHWRKQLGALGRLERQPQRGGA